MLIVIVQIFLLGGENETYYNDLCENSSIVGDINFDGYVNVSDIVLLVNKIVNFYPLTESFDKNEDLNNDGTVNISDIIALIDFTLGI